MSTWLYNPNFPNLLYKKVKNIEEYISSVIELKSKFYLSVNYDGDLYDSHIYPFDGDDDIWNNYFLVDVDAKQNKLDKTNFKLIPKETEFPVLLNFSGNHRYLSWVSINNII